MEELLFGLKPAEFWALNYLILLAQEQGSPHIFLPRPGADPRAEKVYSRSRLKRLIKALKNKRHLTNLIIPKAKNGQIEIILPAKLLGAWTHPNALQRAIHAPKNGVSAPNLHPKGPLRASAHPNNLTNPDTSLKFPFPKLSSRKLELEKLIELKQKDLNRAIQGFSRGETLKLRYFGEALIGQSVKGKQSEQAKLYALIRFMQAGEPIENPGAWLAAVAREYDKQSRRPTSRMAGEPVAVGAMVGVGGQ